MFRVARLIYYSTAEAISDDEMRALVSRARKFNELHSITGTLVYDGQYYLQCLEGSRTELSKLYNRIINDSRHKNVTLIYFKEVPQRLFVGWEMGLLMMPNQSLSRAIFYKYSPVDAFRPDLLDGASANLLMEELAASQYIL